MVERLKLWLGLGPAAEDVAPWSQLMSGIGTGVVTALLAWAVSGRGMAISLFVVCVLIGVVQEVRGRR